MSVKKFLFDILLIFTITSCDNQQTENSVAKEKNPTEEKQTRAMEILAYLMDP